MDQKRVDKLALLSDDKYMGNELLILTATVTGNMESVG